MSGDEFDAVIAGGGLSGLTLAAHLARTDWRDRSVLVIDDAHGDSQNACWASWAAGPELLDPAVSRTYRRVRIHADGVSRVVPLGGYRYRLVRRRDLYRVVTDLLRGCPGFSLRPGRVAAVHDRDGAAEVLLDGQAVRARWAFDSVSSTAPEGGLDARMAFTGWEIVCDRDAFDPDTPTLFDFRTPQADGARFVYVLPDGPRRALVEHTAFVPRDARPPERAAAGAALAEYLAEVVHCGEYQIVRTEAGVLPLRTAVTPRRHGRVLAIGTPGGLIKASTGYAYERIQRDSAAVAASLARHGHPFDLPPPSRRHRLLDAVLLDVLSRDPAQLQRAFARLFLANPAQRVLRFLDEDTSVLQELRLIVTLPPAPYVRAAAARGLSACRRAPRPGCARGRGWRSAE